MDRDELIEAVAAAQFATRAAMSSIGIPWSDAPESTRDRYRAEAAVAIDLALEEAAEIVEASDREDGRLEIASHIRALKSQEKSNAEL